jgi:hypothetical protein
MVTLVSPPIGPEVGVIEPITGDGTKLKLSELFVPPGVVILIGTVPIVCKGVIASISVSPTTIKLFAGVVPKFTLVAPVRLLPVITILLPPAVTPAVGKAAIGVGAVM